MAKKFIQKQQKALADIAAKTLSILPFPDDTPELRASRIALVKAPGWEAFSISVAANLKFIKCVDIYDRSSISSSIIYK